MQLHTRLCSLTLVAAAAVACSDTPASLGPLAPEGPNFAKITLNGGTSKTIQDAINSASAGDTIVLNDTFTMDAEVALKSNITILGGSNDQLTCTSGVNYFGAPSSTGTLDNLVIDGLNADGCGTTGSFIRIYNGGTVSNVTIRNNTIQDFGDHGIQIASDASGAQTITNLLVAYNTISDIDHDGIQVGENTSCCPHSGIDIIRNTVARAGEAGITKRGFGIHVLHSRDVDIERNRVTDTCEEGIRVTKTDQARIKWNYVSGVLSGSGCNTSGIKSDQSTNVTIQADTVKGMLDKPHIKITGGSSISILDNYIRAQSVDDGQVGIELRSYSSVGRVTDVVIDGNDVRYAQHGMKFVAKDRDIDNVDVTDNVVYACTGIWLTYQGDVDGHILYVDMLSNSILEHSVTGCNANDSITLSGVGHSNVWYNTLWTRWNEAYAWDMDYKDNLILDEGTNAT